MNLVLFEIGMQVKYVSKKLRENTEEPFQFYKKCFNSKSNRKLNCSYLKKAPATNRNVKLYRNIEKKKRFCGNEEKDFSRAFSCTKKYLSPISFQPIAQRCKLEKYNWHFAKVLRRFQAFNRLHNATKNSTNLAGGGKYLSCFF